MLDLLKMVKWRKEEGRIIIIDATSHGLWADGESGLHHLGGAVEAKQVVQSVVLNARDDTTLGMSGDQEPEKVAGGLMVKPVNVAIDGDLLPKLGNEVYRFLVAVVMSLV